nr:unnamed protein product [Spirometra erinaceieuropaei]
MIAQRSNPLSQPQGNNDRLMSLRLPLRRGEFASLQHLRPLPITSRDEAKTMFQEGLQVLTATVPKVDNLVVLGVFNVSAGQIALPGEKWWVKCQDMRTHLYTAFADLKKAFEDVSREAQTKSMQTYSKAVDNERLDADEYCRRRHYNGLTPRVSKLCQMLTGYAAEVLLKHVSANGNVKLCSEAVDTCSCRFHRNWQLPCVHIINYIEQNNIEPCRALLKSRWVFRLDVSEMRVTDENVDPEAVTSFQADILVSKGRGPFTEDYKYRVAMRHVQPIVEKLKSCGSRRFEELLREVDEFANWIMNAPSGGLHGSLVDLPPQPNADEMGDDTSDEVVRCQVREEGDVLIAQWGSNQDPSVRAPRTEAVV